MRRFLFIVTILLASSAFASGWVEQSTAVILNLGPFVDSTDGVTAETGLTIAQGDIQISKAGGAFAQTSEGSPTTTHDADGWYPIPLTTTDTATLGRIVVQVQVAGAVPVWWEGMVVPSVVYDSLVNGSDYLGVDLDSTEGTLDAAEIGGDAITAAKIATDAIGASEVAEGALVAGTEITGLADEEDIGDQVWATTARTLTAATLDTGTLANSEDAATYKATGFSTHSAADVWTTANRELSTPNNYKATGFSTHSAADVWLSVTRSLTDKDDFTLSAVGIEEIWDDLHTDNDTENSWGELLQAVLDDTDELQLDWADGGRLELRFDGIEGATFVTGTDSLEAIRNQGDEAWATATVVGLSDGAITAAKIADNAIDAGAIAADAIGASELATDAVTEIDTAMNAAIAELTTDPGATPTPRQILALMYMANRNRVDTTSDTLTYYNDAGEAVFTIALSDDGTIFTRAEMADAE